MYGSGQDREIIQPATKRAAEEIKRLLDQIVSEFAGRYRWWNLDFDVIPYTRTTTFIEEPDPVMASQEVLAILDLVIRLARGSLGDVLRYGRLRRNTEYC